MKYKIIPDLTSDVMFEAYGADIKELFANAAEALFSIICQPDRIGQADSRMIEASGNGYEDLLFNWLQELIAAVDIEVMFFSRFEILELDQNHVIARCYGEDAKPEKGGTVVKAVTNYGYKLEKTESGWIARVALDI